jgi:hypothetical protein
MDELINIIVCLFIECGDRWSVIETIEFNNICFPSLVVDRC